MASQPNHHGSTPGAGGVAAVLAEIRKELRGLTETLWAARGPDELMATVAEIEALKSTLDAIELSVVSELDAPTRSRRWAGRPPRISSPPPRAATRAPDRRPCVWRMQWTSQ